MRTAARENTFFFKEDNAKQHANVSDTFVLAERKLLLYKGNENTHTYSDTHRWNTYALIVHSSVHTQR